MKQTGPIRQVKLRGLHKVHWVFVFSCAAHNLMRLPRLLANQIQQAPAAVRLKMTVDLFKKNRRKDAGTK